MCEAGSLGGRLLKSQTKADWLCNADAGAVTAALHCFEPGGRGRGHGFAGLGLLVVLVTGEPVTQRMLWVVRLSVLSK